MGQWIQDGERTIFETVISVEKSKSEKLIPSDEANLDGLNYIAGKHVDDVNKMAELGTRIAHVDGGVPNMRIIVPELSEEYLRTTYLFLRDILRHLRISARCESIQPARCRGLQKEYVCSS